MAGSSPGDVANTIGALFAKLSNPRVIANLLSDDSHVSHHHVDDAVVSDSTHVSISPPMIQFLGLPTKILEPQFRRFSHRLPWICGFFIP